MLSDHNLGPQEAADLRQEQLDQNQELSGPQTPLDAIRVFFSDSFSTLEDREQKLWEWFINRPPDTDFAPANEIPKPEASIPGATATPPDAITVTLSRELVEDAFEEPDDSLEGRELLARARSREAAKESIHRTLRTALSPSTQRRGEK